MKCFYHPEADAVGICKNCNKGICRECAFELTNGIACRDRCEAEVSALNEQMLMSRGVLNKAGSNYVRNSVLMALFGAPVLIWGIFEVATGSAFGFYLVLFGLFLLASAGVSYVTGKKIAKP